MLVIVVISVSTWTWHEWVAGLLLFSLACSATDVKVGKNLCVNLHAAGNLGHDTVAGTNLNLMSLEYSSFLGPQLVVALAILDGLTLLQQCLVGVESQCL